MGSASWFLVIYLIWPGSSSSTRLQVEYANEETCLRHLQAARIENRAGGESEWIGGAWYQPYAGIQKLEWKE